jgi:hypothetical protein
MRKAGRERPGDAPVIASVIDAMRDAADEAARQRGPARPHGSGDPLPRMTRAVGQTVYAGAYLASFGVVYAVAVTAGAVLLAVGALPRNNPLVQGLHDGGIAGLGASQRSIERTGARRGRRRARA